MFVGEIEPQVDLFDDSQTSFSPECIQQRLEVTKAHVFICSPWFASEKNNAQATNYSKDRWFAMCSVFMWSAGAGIKAARKVLKDCSLLPSPSASPTLTCSPLTSSLSPPWLPSPSLVSGRRHTRSTSLTSTSTLISFWPHIDLCVLAL